MTVIPMTRPDARSREPSSVSGRDPEPRYPCGSIPVRGTFQCPRGLTGTMQGILRLEHFRMGRHGAVVDCVFAGELFDGAGTHIGRGSRRESTPLHLSGPVLTDSATGRKRASTTNAVIDPVTVDVMGFAVSIPETTIPARCAMGQCIHRNDCVADNRETEER